MQRNGEAAVDGNRAASAAAAAGTWADPRENVRACRHWHRLLWAAGSRHLSDVHRHPHQAVAVHAPPHGLYHQRLRPRDGGFLRCTGAALPLHRQGIKAGRGSPQAVLDESAIF